VLRENLLPGASAFRFALRRTQARRSSRSERRPGRGRAGGL